MSTFTWGKIGFSEMPKILNDFVFEDSPVYFSDIGNDLFVSGLLKDEKYFNIALGQEKLMDISRFGFINGDDNYFVERLSKKVCGDEYFKTVKRNVERFERTIKTILNISGVIRMTLYHSEDGYESSEDGYEDVDWNIDNFASGLFASMEKNGMFTPAFKAVFIK